MMRTHTGTHIDSPRQFIPTDRTLDEDIMSKFVNESVVLDVTDVGNAAAISIDEIAYYESAIGSVDVVIFTTR
mgnify:CR=1 FL=1